MHASALSGLAAAMALATRAPCMLHMLASHVMSQLQECLMCLLNGFGTIEWPAKIQCEIPSSATCLLDATPSIIACENIDNSNSADSTSQHRTE